ncbi:MAG: DNA polymerase III subunit delta, partial [Bacteroidales bacterium]|nr:DNA polymerase III subunit delta [Bacteroidales bacterium]
MTYEQILSDIKNKIYHPVYFLMGEEPYFIDSISDAIESTVLDEADKAFNQIILYGKDVNVHDIVTQARNFPMMGNYLVIIVKEAQDVKNIESMEPFLEMIPETTILVLNYKYKKLDKRLKFAKTLDKDYVLFESKKLYDRDIPKWIVNYLGGKNYKIQQKACQMLADYLGTDLQKVRNELDKLMVAVPNTKEITDFDVEYNIGISKDFNIFELQKAISYGDFPKAVQIINYFGDNTKDNPLIATVIMLYAYYCKLLKLHYATDKSKNNVASVLG